MHSSCFAILMGGHCSLLWVFDIFFCPSRSITLWIYYVCAVMNVFSLQIIFSFVDLNRIRTAVVLISSHFTNFILYCDHYQHPKFKGKWSKEASWPENTENVYFLPSVIHLIILGICMPQKCFLLWVPWGNQVGSLCNSDSNICISVMHQIPLRLCMCEAQSALPRRTKKEKKRGWHCDTFYTFPSLACQPSLCSYTVIDCWAQHGSTHGHIFTVFKRRFFF